MSVPIFQGWPLPVCLRSLIGCAKLAQRALHPAVLLQSGTVNRLRLVRFRLGLSQWTRAWFGSGFPPPNQGSAHEKIVR
ncbi:MAG: hypothetical protein H7Z41_09410 [Cytophagales bacterium]|nr:hypothetical protein [Armatimonadota bacterium]